MTLTADEKRLVMYQWFRYYLSFYFVGLVPACADRSVNIDVNGQVLQLGGLYDR